MAQNPTTTTIVPHLRAGDGGAGLQNKLPAVVQAQVVDALASVAPQGPAFHHSAAPLPDEIDAMFPLGYGENQPCADADDQVRGVPNQSRKRKDTLREALLYYRTQYRLGECERVSEAPPCVPRGCPRCTHGLWFSCGALNVFSHGGSFSCLF
ncbi:hypothetical protein B0H14DRAFT_2588834 [Mycena olivaceomarginata]|nr:hypothetical protein B0H14DRAFT_2588834 [Mycena olivaceomarginata]